MQRSFLNMEKSMVRELSGLASSQFITNRSTFISTAFNEGDDELRKSRIQNLPSYRKEDLSNKLPFVVVFQTIEIERLSQEIQALRIAIKDTERQQFNMQNYEIQIRELTEKVHAYEAERDDYKDQAQKLNLICEKLYEELEVMKTTFANVDPTIKEKYRLERERNQQFQEQIQKWRTRYVALESSKNREMQDMKLMFESQRRSMIDREIHELTLKHRSETQNLQKQIRKLRQGLEERSGEILRLNNQLAKVDARNRELQQSESLVIEYENKVVMLSQQTVRLNDLLRNKNQEIERLSSSEVILKRKIEQLEYALREAHQGGPKIRILQEQVRQWQNRCDRMEGQRLSLQQDLATMPQLQRQIQQVRNENENLKGLMRDKISQIESWRSKWQRFEDQAKQSRVMDDERTANLQTKITQLDNENNRLNDNLRRRAEEIENWRAKYSDIQKQIRQIDLIKSQKNQIQHQLNTNIGLLNDAEQRAKHFQMQLGRLGNLQDQYHHERASRQEAGHEIDRLNHAVQNLSEKAEDYRRKYEKVEKQLLTFSKVEQEIRIYKQKQIGFVRELDRINGIISEKQKLIQELKENFMTYESRIKQYQGFQNKLMESVSQTQKLIGELDESRKEAGLLQNQLVNAESNLNKLKNDIFAINQEKDQTIRLLNARSQELELSKAELGKIQDQISGLRQQQAQFRGLEDKFRKLQSQFQEEQRKFYREQQNNRKLNQQLELKVSELHQIKAQGMISSQLKEQLFSLREYSERKNRQIQSLEGRIQRAETIIVRLKEETYKNDQMTKRNHQKWMAVGQKLEVSFDAFRKMAELQGQIGRLHEENIVLEGKMKIMDVENEGMRRSIVDKNRIEPSEFDMDTATITIHKRRIQNNFKGDVISPRARPTSSALSFNRQRSYI